MTEEEDNHNHNHHHRRRSKREKYSISRFVAAPSNRRNNSDNNMIPNNNVVVGEQPFHNVNNEEVANEEEESAVAVAKAEEEEEEEEQLPRRRTARSVAPKSYQDPPEEDDDDEDDEEDTKTQQEATTTTNNNTSSSTSTTTSPDSKKPRLNSTIRIHHGPYINLTGQITNIKIGGWCTIDNEEIDKPVRMSHLELVKHNDVLPKLKSSLSRSDDDGVKKKGRKRNYHDVNDIITSPRGASSSGSGGGNGGRPVRERRPPPQSLLMSPLSSSSTSPYPSRRRLSTRTSNTSTGGSNSGGAIQSGTETSIRRSRRGPTPSPKALSSFEEYHDNDHDEEHEKGDEEEVRPRGRRGRATAAGGAAATSPKRNKSSPAAATPSSPLSRSEAAKVGWAKRRAASSTTPSPNKKPSGSVGSGSGRSRNKYCQVKKCNKYSQYNCEGYCMLHYRQYVLDNDDDEMEEEVISPPKKRARHAKEEGRELDKDDDTSLFDHPPRKGGSRYYCKVKKCQRWSQGQPKEGMCYSHFKLYGSKKKKATGGKSKGGRPPPAAAKADDNSGDDGIIRVGSLVVVKERTGVGMNKPGGVGRVTKMYAADVDIDDDEEEVMVYDVKYVLGGREKGVTSNSLWLHDPNAKSPLKPPPGFGGDEDNNDVAMLDDDEEEDESIEDDELEGYDEFSLSQLDVPGETELDARALRREEQLNARRLIGCQFHDGNDGTHPGLEESNWKCAKCEAQNYSTSLRCSTCQFHRVEKNDSEDALLERTRYELLNGNDFWICTNCVVGVPSVLMPCGRCHTTIPFVPLTMPEFEDFVRKQRQIKRKRQEEIQCEWKQKLEEVSEEWIDPKEIEREAKQQKKELKKQEGQPIVTSEDKSLILDYFYLGFEQYHKVSLQASERREQRYKKFEKGYAGIACKHCDGKANRRSGSGQGRFFPSSEAALYQQTFSNNAVRHLLECPHCPKKVSFIP
jgi:hypothetical protein